MRSLNKERGGGEVRGGGVVLESSVTRLGDFYKFLSHNCSPNIMVTFGLFLIM